MIFERGSLDVPSRVAIYWRRPLKLPLLDVLVPKYSSELVNQVGPVQGTPRVLEKANMLGGRSITIKPTNLYQTNTSSQSSLRVLARSADRSSNFLILFI